MAISKITTKAITDGTIATADLADNAVNSAKIGADVIVAEDVANNAITVNEIQNGAVTSAKLDTNIAVSGTLGVTGALTAGSLAADGGVSIDNITIDGTEIDLSSGSLTVDSAGSITLDCGNGELLFNNAGNGNLLKVQGDSSNVNLITMVQDKDLVFKGNDGGSTITALTLDMSAGGNATFNNSLAVADGDASAPGFRFKDDLNNGMFRVGTDIIGLSTAGTQRMQIDASGRVGIGAGNNGDYHANRDDLIIATSGSTGITLVAGGSGHQSAMAFADGTGSDAIAAGLLMYNHNGNVMSFHVSDAEVFRANNKGLLINTNTTLHTGVERALEVQNNSASGFVAIFKGNTASHETICIHNSATSGTRILVAFKTSGSTGTIVGRITSNGSTTDYATSSDYRLKENVEYNWDATTRLKQLKPARFNWIADESNTTVDGFIAHEVSSVVPEAITGEKDAMTEELLYVDGDEIPDGKKVGDVKEASQIDPQSIDQSKIVPLLVKTIQELEARITALESA